MPKAKERKPDDKIKNQGKRKGGRPVQDQARRVMTAKMRKELAQQKRSASGSTGEAARETSPTAEAVEQVEQTAGAAVRETGHRTKQGVSKAVTKAKQERRKIKERQEQPKEKDQPPEPPAPETPEAPAPELNHPAPREQAGRTPPRSKPQPTGRTNTGPAAPKEKPVPPVRSRAPKTRPASSQEAPAIPRVRPAGTQANPPVPRTRTAGTRPAPIPLNLGRRTSRPLRQRRGSVCGNGPWISGGNRSRNMGEPPPRRSAGSRPRSVITGNLPLPLAAPSLRKRPLLLKINPSIHQSKNGPGPPPL